MPDPKFGRIFEAIEAEQAENAMRPEQLNEIQAACTRIRKSAYLRQ
jgi:hypothetical protein